MLKKLRRKIYRKIRFQTWYRKANYYHRKRNDLNKTIAQYRRGRAEQQKAPVPSAT